MTTPTQTLAHGSTVASRYGKFGSTGGTYRAPLGRVFWMLLSYPGEGKSYLNQSNPAALILNLDGSSTKAQVEAQVTPVLSPSGALVGLDGQPLVPTWDWLEALKKELITAAINNAPRPESIVVDTLGSLLRIAAIKYGSGFTDAKQVYEVVTNFILDLKQYYGVCVCGHMQKVKVKPKDAEMGDLPDIVDNIAHSDKLHARIFPYCELVLVLWSQPEAVSVEVAQTAQVRGETVQLAPKRTSKMVTRRYLSPVPYEMPADYKPLLGIVKRRAQFPDKVAIPETGAWAAVASAYDEANK